MPSIPEDIWIHVAQFIPQDTLRSMLNINSTLFQLAMDARYHDANFTTLDNGVLQRIRRLKDPAISHRVRRLAIDPWFIEKSVNEDSEHTGDNGVKHFSASFEEIIQAMTDTVTCLTNLTDFSINWIDLPAEEQLLPFLTAAWKTFGSGLRKFAFLVSLEYLPALLSTAGGLTELRELDVELHEGSQILQKAEQDMILSTILAPFVNAVAPTLRNLSLSSWMDDLELSPLFRSLGNLPKLVQLQIFLDFDMCGLSDPLSFTRFLRSHSSTLSGVQWSTFVESHHSGNVLAKDQFMVSWLNENKFDESILSNLLTLRLPVPDIPATFDLTLPYIRRSAGTLTSLKLWGYTFSYDEVNTLVSVFAHRQAGLGHLQELSLHVRFLSPDLFLLLARTLPGLKKLSLNTLNVAAKNAPGETEAITWEDELSNAKIFADTMRKYDIHNWPLRDIDITTFGCVNPNIGVRLMRVLAECVPSVQTFYGMAKDGISIKHNDYDPPIDSL